jgi:hypothetical protein
MAVPRAGQGHEQVAGLKGAAVDADAVGRERGALKPAAGRGFYLGGGP